MADANSAPARMTLAYHDRPRLGFQRINPPGLMRHEREQRELTTPSP
jgi:hypothetical protein